MYDEEKLLLLDALLCGTKLLPINPTRLQVQTLHNGIELEHKYMLAHEPPDEFHACVLLGALNLLSGMLKETPGGRA